MTKFLTIKQAADLLGVSTQTLRRWEKAGKISKAQRTNGNQRRYDIASLKPTRANKKCERLTLAYARVSSTVNQKLLSLGLRQSPGVRRSSVGPY